MQTSLPSPAPCPQGWRPLPEAQWVTGAPELTPKCFATSGPRLCAPPEPFLHCGVRPNPEREREKEATQRVPGGRQTQRPGRPLQAQA